MDGVLRETIRQMPETAPSVQQRLVVFGMSCAFTDAVVTVIRDAPGSTLAAIALAGEPGMDPGRAAGCPVWHVPNRADLDTPSLRANLARIAPDLVVVACFPRRIPDWLLALPRHGCLNVHPSLLPDGRGPDPVFWAFRWGLRETGVTIHRMDAGFDTGPIVARRRLAIPPDATIPSLERDLAEAGAALLLDSLPAIVDGSLVPRPQDPGSGRYAPMPRADDLLTPTAWPASRAARFIQAVIPVYGTVPVLVEGTGQRLAVADVLDATDDATMADAVQLQGTGARIRFTPGGLTVRLAMPPQPLSLVRQATG
jgi:methionyl-tRNA formyltransferase